MPGIAIFHAIDNGTETPRIYTNISELKIGFWNINGLSSILDDENSRNRETIPKGRNNPDKVINTFGRSLIDISQSSDMCLLNGRTLGDLLGTPTCFRPHGCSLVDYIIVQHSVFNQILSFNVMPISDLSDHRLIFCELNIPNYFKKPEKRLTSCVKGQIKTTNKSLNTRFIWTPLSSELYQFCLNQTELKKMTNSFMTTDFDYSVGGVTKDDILLNAAKSSLRMSKNTCHGKKKNRWFDKDCKRLYRKVNKAKWLLNKDPQNKTLLKHYALRKKEYKKISKFKSREAKRKLLEQIDELESNNPREYWKLVNRLVNNKNDEDPGNISLSQWEDHYNKLFNPNLISDPLTKTKIDRSIEIHDYTPKSQLNQEINRPISTTELRSAIKKLKNNKSSGPDLIINEMIKTSFNILQDHLKLFKHILSSGHIPDGWNESFILPIHKTGDKSDPNN
ncbi:hypothetical protein LOTGIDRAFT_154542 [Lottia gigantea]|uniref:Endonuclease/exonuclease/phosphatase domain-containing protein n=1 Tax=Lottia gigantea TaxID=225164 RepID=V3ZWR1_LOTGI|nr:hypothetical protein LOTGIDRAFT_154542 [Lottia gigantea]ESO87055.1 hypothetical protein LOTGIDRAFT_154542 [Lottia gigantea]